jgi:hypothetical protein
MDVFFSLGSNKSLYFFDHVNIQDKVALIHPCSILCYKVTDKMYNYKMYGFQGGE